MSIDRIATYGLILLMVAAISLPSRASSEERAEEERLPGTTEREVLGWADDGDLLVRRTSRGERMVSGRSADFFFELTERREAATGVLVEVYRHGEGSGATPPIWEEAASVAEAQEAFDEAARRDGRRQWHSPDGRVALTTFGWTTTERIEETPRGTQFRCVRHQRLVAALRDWDRVAVLEAWTEKGDRSTRRDETPCPEVGLEASWHPDSSHWALVRTVTLSGAQVRPPTVYAGGSSQDMFTRRTSRRGQKDDEQSKGGERTSRRGQKDDEQSKGGERTSRRGQKDDEQSKGAERRERQDETEDDDAAERGRTAPVLRADTLLGSWIEELPGEKLRAGYRALHDGQLERAREKFSAETDSKSERAQGFAAAGLARVAAREGDERETESQLETMQNVLDEPFWETAVAAACQRRLGDMERSNLQLERAFEHASSPLHLVRLGELFRFYDVEVANRAFGEALDSDARSGIEGGRRYAYGLLVEGTVDAGRYDQADVLIEELSSVPAGLRPQKLRADLERIGTRTAELEGMADRVGSFLSEHPGSCAGYLLDGRLRATQRRLAEARRQFRVAHLCDGADPTAAFYLGAIALRTGDWSDAERHLHGYLDRAVSRRGDGDRERRRRLAESYLERIGHTGVVLTAVDCQPHPLSGTLCRAVVENTADEMLEEIEVRAVRVGGEGAAMASTTVSELTAGQSQTVGLRLTNVDLGEVRIEAGRDKGELGLNGTPALFR